jgi:hypothetical protein
MCDSKRNDFLAWYEGQKSLVFDKARLGRILSDAAASVQVFRREFKQTGNIHVFLESITIASACNKVLRKRLLQSNTIGLIPTEGYSGNVWYSKKALMWFGI